MTAREKAFLKQGKATPRAKKTKPKTAPKSQTKKEELPMSKPAPIRQVVVESPPEAPRTELPTSPPKANFLTARIDSRIADALLRAATERRIQRIVPATHQDIVGEAMADWLKKHGYFR
jgi:hypothetical protein